MLNSSSSPPIRCQVLLDPPESGAWNMALDEVLLHRAAREGIATLRCYQWRDPTLSLGYFQQLAHRLQHTPSEHAAVVRRQSGGGAILHDQELTYSLSLPAAHPMATRTTELYRTTHRVIIALLESTQAKAGVLGKLCLADPQLLANVASEPFLCFQRRSVGDILWRAEKSESLSTGRQTPRPSITGEDHKIVGSAQRRHRGAVLQHGSILLGRSECAPELPGWNDLLKQSVTPEWLGERLANTLPKALTLQAFEAKLTDDLRKSAEDLMRSKYGSDAWTHRR